VPLDQLLKDVMNRMPNLVNFNLIDKYFSPWQEAIYFLVGMPSISGAVCICSHDKCNPGRKKGGFLCNNLIKKEYW